MSLLVAMIIAVLCWLIISPIYQFKEVRIK